MGNILVLGSMFPEDTEREVMEKSKASTLQFAANAHLRMLADGIDMAVGDRYTLMNILPVGSYPKRYKDMFIKGFGFEYGHGTGHINVGYCNISLIKQISKPLCLTKAAVKWAKRQREKFTVFVYTAEPEFMIAASALKKRFDCHICQIVTDLPEYTDIDKGANPIYKIATEYRVRNAAAKIRAADSYVFLTKAMAEHFGVCDKPYIVMEGVVPYGGSDTDGYAADGDVKNVVYTGSLTRKYGVMDLAEAFMRIKDENLRLVICGSGETEEEIRALKDKRIIYKGALTHSEAAAVQRSATLLVNPRNNKDEFTKYSFPSKLMEYMMTARPVLCFKLDGIPDEYDEYLNYFTSDNSMAEDIQRYCAMSEEELAQKGRRARRYVCENKNSYKQALRMLELTGEA